MQFCNHQTELATFFIPNTLTRALGLSLSQFFDIMKPFPRKTEQEKFSSVLEAEDSEIELFQKEFEAIKQQKKGLMQKFLTGEVRVKLLKGSA